MSVKDFSTRGVERNLLLYNGTVEMKFSENGHRYSINNIDIVGVTTVLKTVIAKEALINWAVKMTADYMLTNYKYNSKYSKEQFEELVLLAKKAHRMEKEASADVGTRVHSWIEQYIIAKIYKNNIPEVPVEKDLVSPIASFLEWEKVNHIVWEEAEKVIYSKRYDYAGTLDFLAVVNGKRMVGDIKTSNAIYPESYYLQVAAYRYALQEEKPEIKIDGMLILRIPKTSKSTFEVRMINDYENNAKAFIYGLYLYRQVMKLKNYNK